MADNMKELSHTMLAQSKSNTRDQCYKSFPSSMILHQFVALSCRIFGSFGNPALEKLEFRLSPPLSYFDHLVSQVKITLSWLPPFLKI